jgi:hypothetical protein
MKNRDSCIFYRSMYEAIKDLPKDTKAEIYDAIFGFSLDFVEPELSGLSKTIWILIRPVLDKGNTNYINGNKAKTKRLGSETEAKPKPIVSEHEAYKDKDKDVDKDNEKDKDLNKKQKVKFDLFGQHFSDSDVNKEFIEFIKNRIELKKRPTERAIKVMVEKARNIYKNKHEVIQAIKNSIASGWSDLYPLNTNTKPNQQKTYSRSDHGLHFK